MIVRVSDESDNKRLLAGLAFWIIASLFLLYHEVRAAFWKPAPPWVTISHTIGHLEERWHVLAPIVVATIVVIAVHTYRTRTDESVRTPGGRLTPTPHGDSARRPPSLWAWLAYLAVTAVVVSAASYYVSTRSDIKRTYDLEYVMYGLLAFFCLVVPSVFALVLQRDVPFPTLLQTLILIEERQAWIALVLAALLGILVIHLGLYPWPGSLPPPSRHP